jgi:hypothetical protein
MSSKEHHDPKDLNKPAKQLTRDEREKLITDWLNGKGDSSYIIKPLKKDGKYSIKSRKSKTQKVERFQEEPKVVNIRKDSEEEDFNESEESEQSDSKNTSQSKDSKNSNESETPIRLKAESHKTIKSSDCDKSIVKKKNF